MGRNPITQIDIEKCTGCGKCVDCCPANTLSLVNGKAVVTGTDSMHCGHCAAICPEGAVSLPGIESPSVSHLPSSAALDMLLDTMRGRRPIRAYKNTPVDRAVLDDLVRAGTLAPSGTNAQKWTFTVVPTLSAQGVLESSRWTDTDCHGQTRTITDDQFLSF